MACPTCGGMFANNTKFLDHIRRQTSLDRKQLERRGRVWAIPLKGKRSVFTGEEAAEETRTLALLLWDQAPPRLL